MYNSGLRFNEINNFHFFIKGIILKWNLRFIFPLLAQGSEEYNVFKDSLGPIVLKHQQFYSPLFCTISTNVNIVKKEMPS